MEGVLSKHVHNPDSYHNGINDTQVKAEEKIWNESEAASNSNSPPCVMQEKCAGFNSFQNTTSFSSNYTHLLNGSEDLEEQLLHSIRPDSKIVVDDLLEKIRQLSLLQKMLLYLKLPPSSDDPDCTDPIRKPLNPLGNRLEVSQALAYIRSHFLPDPDVSLPKKDIYNEYTTYCLRRKTKPLSTADFGKAMKQVYPVVRPRRLGERGNSRYCYSGLRNRDHLSKPNTPQFPNCQARDDVSSKICTWASTILKTQVKNLTELSSIISSNPVSIQSEHVQDSSSEVLQERFLKGLADRKRKLKVDDKEASQSKSTKKKKTANFLKCKSEKTFCKKGLKLLKDSTSAQSPQDSTVAANSDTSNICDISNQKQINVDTIEIKNSHINCFDLKSEQSTNLEKKSKVNGNNSAPVRITQILKKNSDISRVIRHKLRKSSEVSNLPVPTEDNFGIASIEEEPLLEVKSGMKEVSRKEKAGNSLNFSGKPSLSNDIRQLNDNFIRNISVNIDISDTQDCDQSDMYNDDLGYLTTESLHDFLQDEGNSQEPEEELLKYFKDPVKSEQKEYNDKNISQLRLLLEQNISEEAIGKFRCQSSSFSEEELSKTKQVDLNNYLISSIQKNIMQPTQKSVFTAALTNNNCKRRVSFENNIPDSFPQSPNIYRKNFSFTPISPRPPTMSKSNTNLSPFVFPRDTVFRGKLSSTNFNGNSQTQPAPSPVLQTALVQMSTLKSLSRSTSLSSTPSPVINNCSSSSNNTVLKGRSTPQDTNQEQLESLKYSPLISPSSSSGVFLSPASPMSSCNSPVFSFRKSMSPVKLPDDTKSVVKPTSSLLQSLLLTGKCSEINIPNKNKNRYDTVDKSNEIKTEPLAVDVSQFTSECPTSFRSHSVPTLTRSEAISPKSNTLPFPVSISKNKKLSSLEIKPSELYVWDSALNGYKRAYDSILTENSFENETMHDSSEIGGNEESMETVISNLCEFLTDNEIARTNATEPSRISRSQPNTPVVYNECSNSSRDPIVSALPLMSASKSYPSTPTACTSQMVDTTNWSAKRNIIPLLDNLSIPGPSFSDDIELHLNNLADLSGCSDTFNELAQEVASTTEYKELQ